MARVLVTGAAGVIGTQLCQLLVERGDEVVAADLKPQPKEISNLREYRQGDLNGLTAEQYSRMNPDLVYHLAATFERTTESLGFFQENFVHNVSLTHHILSLAAGAQKRTKVVFASSYLLYDEDQYLVNNDASPVSLSETSKLRPRNLTGHAKFAGEKELDFLSSFSETSVHGVSARIFRGYGLGSRDVISRWVRSLLNGNGIEVYDSQSSFDFIYCKDSASGLVALGSSDAQSGVFNVSSAKSKAMQEVLDVLLAMFPNARIGEGKGSARVEKSRGDISRISDLTDWSPKFSLQRAIEEIVEFEMRQK